MWNSLFMVLSYTQIFMLKFGKLFRTRLTHVFIKILKTNYKRYIYLCFQYGQKYKVVFLLNLYVKILIKST